MSLDELQRQQIRRERLARLVLACAEWSTGLDEAAALDLDDECAATARRAIKETE